jgi:hypothetical protein
MTNRVNPIARRPFRAQLINITLGALCALPLLHDGDAAAASLSRSVDVDAPAAQVWSVIGPFCAIKDWHPVVGTCTLDKATAPVRTIVMKDGKTTFVEPQIARNESSRFYAYTFKSSPFPVTHYMGTVWVVPNTDRSSTVLWTGTYTPFDGKDAEAEADFAGVFESGLAALKARFAH